MPYAIHEETLAPQHAAAVRVTVPLADIGPTLGRIFGDVAAYLAGAGVPMTGPPFARYYSVAPESVDVEAGFPVPTSVPPRGDVRPAELPGGPAATTMHVGPYDAMEPAYAEIAEWIRAHGREANGAAWEVYFSDPEQVPDPAQWQTKIVQPLK